MTNIVFTQHELEVMPNNPDVLDALADYHSLQETMAAGMDFYDSAEFHKNRYTELRAEATRIRATYDSN